jgi:endonuclease/exonuclease/phosphatase family metal-dependent hydrolase
MTVPMRCACRSVHTLGALLSTFLALICTPAVAAAQTIVTLDSPGTEVNADTTIRGGGYAAVNYSTSDILELKASSNVTNQRRVVLKFDTQNLVPAGAVINSAKLTLVLKSAGDSASRPIGAYRVTRSFSGPETNWLDAKDASPWSKAGSDLGEKYTTTYVGNAVGSAYTFDLTQLVQRAVKGDFGSRFTRVALVDTGSPSGGPYRSFYSTRASNTAVRPRLVVSYGASNSTSTNNTSTTGATLRVMQWNIHKTMGTDGKCNPDRIASWIVKLAPQIVSMNEVSYYSGTCSYYADQGATLETLLERKTGQAWYRMFVNANNKAGNLILSRLPFASSSTHSLSYQRAVVQVGVVVNGRNVNVFSTHVDYFNSSYRTTQTNQAKSWTSNFSSPRIVMGDFNTWPGTSDYYIMANAYSDGWAAAKSMGTGTAYNGTGATRGASRFDYVYYTKVTQLVLKSVTVPDTRSSGVYPSDHDPVVAVFQVQ